MPRLRGPRRAAVLVVLAGAAVTVPAVAVPAAGAPATTVATRDTSAARTATNGVVTFQGPSLGTASVFPPDTQGDVGPTQFFATLNTEFVAYDKATGLPSTNWTDVPPETFFASAMDPTPNTFMSDPHVRYDRLSGRWFVVMIDVPGGLGALPNHVLIAVSDGATLSSSTTWAFFHIDAPATTFFDYPTLGIDAHALYIGTNNFDLASTFTGTSGFVVQKSSLLVTPPATPAAPTYTAFTLGGAASGMFTPQGVDDPLDASPFGYFIGVDDVSGTLDLYRVTNPGSATPTLSSLIQLTVPDTAFPINVPHKGNNDTTNGLLDGLDDRLYAATMTADGHIWTAHDIGVVSTGVASGSPDRDGSRWYEVAPGTGTSPTLVQSGTVYDTAASNPRSYWVPTLAVSGQRRMVIAGSTAGATHYADAWYAVRNATDPAGKVSAPTLFTTSADSYNPGGDNGLPFGARRWGDYSLTRVDPQDNQTIWTIQEWVSGPDEWGTQVAQIGAPAPPTLAFASTIVPTGKSSYHVTLHGTSTGGAGWYDPGAGFPKRLHVTVGCGVKVNKVAVTSPTTLSLYLDTTSATPGSCKVTTVNPDGQSTAAKVLTVARYQADGKVYSTVIGKYLGNNIYNLTGANQAVGTNVKRTASHAFKLAAQNDGSVAERLRVKGPGGGTAFTVHYFYGSADVTAKVVKGTFLTGALGAGVTKVLRLVVTVRPGATIGQVRSWLVVVSSYHDTAKKDAVKATVTVVKG